MEKIPLLITTGSLEKRSQHRQDWQFVKGKSGRTKIFQTPFRANFLHLVVGKAVIF